MPKLEELSDRAFVRGRNLKQAVSTELANYLAQQVATETFETKTGAADKYATKGQLNQYLTAAAAAQTYAAIADLAGYEQKAVLAYSTPSSGATVTTGASGTVKIVIIEPSADLSSLTVRLPHNPTGGDGSRHKVAFAKAVASLTVDATGSATVLGAPTTSAAGSFMEFVFRNAAWYRCG